MASVLYDILSAVQTQIQGLSLTDIDNANIQVAQVRNPREVVSVMPGLPGILIFPLGAESMPPAAGTVCKDDIGYPVAVAIFDYSLQATEDDTPAGAQTGAPDQDYNMDQKFQWRQDIRRKFFHKRLTGVSSVWNCTIEPMPIVDTTEWLNTRGGLWVSMMILRFLSREARS